MTLRKTWLRAPWGWLFLLVAVCAGGLTLFACNSTEPGQPTFEVRGDSAWLKLDSLTLTRVNDKGETVDTLFHGKLSSLNQLKNLPAGDYDGGKTTLVVKGYKSGEEVLGISGDFDSQTKTTQVDTKKDLLQLPTAVAFAKDSLELALGATQDVAIAALPNFVAQAFLWSSSGDAAEYSTKTVDGGMVVTVKALKLGTYRVVAKAALDTLRTDTLKVVVRYAATASVSLNRDTVTLKSGGYRDSLKASVLPATADPQVVFASTDTAKVRVDSLGYLVSVDTGMAYVTATSGAKSDSTVVVVVGNRKPVVLGLRDTVVSIGDTVHLYALIRDADGQVIQVGVDVNRDGALDDTVAVHADSDKPYHFRRIFADTGTYRVVVGAKDNDSAIGLSMAVIQVELDVPVVNAGADTSGKSGTPMKLSGSATQKFGAIVMWKWDFDGDGKYDDSSASTSAMTHVYGKDGTYSAKLLARDDDGNEATDVREVTLGNLRPQVATKRADTTVSIKDSVAFSATLVDEDGVLTQIAWDYDGDGKYDDSSSLNGALVQVKSSYRYAAANDYKAVLRAKDNGGGQVTDTIKVKVLLDAPVANAGNDTTVLTATTVTLHARGTDGYGSIVKREWKIGENDYVTVGTADTSFTAPSVPTQVWCWLRVTDDDGLSHVDSLLFRAVYDSISSLSTLPISTSSLSPAFSATTLAYTVSVANTIASIRLTPTAGSSRATLTINGAAPSGSPAGVTVNLPTPGANVAIPIVVTAQDTSKKTTYTVTATRLRSAEVNLAALRVIPVEKTSDTLTLSPVFTGAGRSFTATVSDTTDSVIVSLVKGQSEQTLRVNSATSANDTWRVKADTGVTTVTIQSTSGNGTVANTTLKIYRRGWILVGNPIFTPSGSGYASYTGLNFYQGNPVFGYVPSTGFVNVSTYASGAWGNLGANPLSLGSSAYAKFASGTANYYSAFRDGDAAYNYKVRLRRWNGSTWGSWTLSDSTAGGIALATFNDTAYVAYWDYNPTNKQRLQVKKLNASGVVTQLGTTISDSTTSSYIAIAVDASGNPWVAYTDNYSTYNGRITVKRWTGSAWTSVQYGVSGSQAYYLNLAIKNDTAYLAYRDNANLNKLTVLRRPVSGGSWDNYGASGFSVGIANYVAMDLTMGYPVVAYTDASLNNAIVVRRYRNGEWEYIGNTRGVHGGNQTYYPALAYSAGGIPYIGFYAYYPTPGLYETRVHRYYDPQAEGQ